MSVLKRRSRTVSFRLSENEYEAMMAGCISRGSRSLSDFARTVACEHAQGPGSLTIELLKARVEELDRVVQTLSQRLSESVVGCELAEG
jgi:hypothetical protein